MYKYNGMLKRTMVENKINIREARIILESERGSLSEGGKYGVNEIVKGCELGNKEKGKDLFEGQGRRIGQKQVR